jgi:hypothetical protein
MIKLENFRKTRGIAGRGAKMISAILMKIIRRVLGCKNRRWGFMALQRLTNTFFQLYANSRKQLLTQQCRKAPDPMKRQTRPPARRRRVLPRPSRRAAPKSNKKINTGVPRRVLPRPSRRAAPKPNKKINTGNSKSSLEARVKRLEQKVFSTLKDSDEEEAFTEADLQQLHEQTQKEGLTDEGIATLDEQAWAGYDPEEDLKMSSEVAWGIDDLLENSEATHAGWNTC